MRFAVTEQRGTNASRARVGLWIDRSRCGHSDRRFTRLGAPGTQRGASLPLQVHLILALASLCGFIALSTFYLLANR